MRYLFLFLFLIPVLSNAQDCRVARETDPFTKDVKVSTGFIQLENASLNIDADAKEIDMFFSLTGADKCYDNNSVAAVYFAGTKSKMTTRNSGTMNCEGYFHFTFKNGTTVQSLLQKMRTQKLSQIIFTGNNKKETTLKLDEEDQELVMKLVDCLLTEAATLIKPQ